MSVRCEVCGSNNIIKTNSLFVCQGCGVKYTLDELKRVLAKEDKIYEERKENNSSFEATDPEDALSRKAEQDLRHIEKEYGLEMYGNCPADNPDQISESNKKHMDDQLEQFIKQIKDHSTISNYAHIFGIVIPLVRKNYPKALFCLALCYDLGSGVAENKSIASYWYEKSANFEYPEAQAYIGYNYGHEGQGVDVDYDKAIFWLVKAAEKNNAKAALWLGVHYESGLGVEKSPEKAHQYYIKSAELGDGDGMCNTGIDFLMGRGVEKDSKEAAYWNKKAAALNISKAQYNLAEQYRLGDGIPQDYDEAIHWYMQAALGGSLPARSFIKQAGLWDAFLELLQEKILEQKNRKGLSAATTNNPDNSIDQSDDQQGLKKAKEEFSSIWSELIKSNIVWKKNLPFSTDDVLDPYIKRAVEYKRKGLYINALRTYRDAIICTKVLSYGIVDSLFKLLAVAGDFIDAFSIYYLASKPDALDVLGTTKRRVSDLVSLAKEYVETGSDGLIEKLHSYSGSENYNKEISDIDVFMDVNTQNLFTDNQDAFFQKIIKARVEELCTL